MTAELLPTISLLGSLLLLSFAMGAAGLAKYAETNLCRFMAGLVSVLCTIAGAGLAFGRIITIIVTR